MKKKLRQKNKVFVKESETELKDTIQKLKARNKKLEKSNKKLKSELKTLNDAFKQTEKFLKNQLVDYSLDDILLAIKERKNLKKEIAKLDTRRKCPKCGKGTITETVIPNVGTLEGCSDCVYMELKKDEYKD